MNNNTEQLVELKVDGMTCNNCAASLNKYLVRKGFDDVYVNFSTKEVRFHPQDSSFSIDDVKTGIHDLGFHVIEDGDNHTAPFWTLEKKLVISAIFTLPLFLEHFFMMAGVEYLSFLENYWIQFAICLPVFIIGLLHFGKSAWSSLKGGVPNMDVLIFIGSSAAFVYSLVGTFLWNGDYIFYETAATIITLVLLGNYMEKRAVEQTTTAIGDLAKLKVEKANLILPSGEITSVDVKDIQVGNLLQINEGDSIPLDGTILKGNATVDESMISGESIPVEKTEGDSLIGATMLLKGNARIKVTAVGNKTVLSQMIELVKSAQQNKPEIQRLADKISAIFVPVVLGISVLTFVVSVLAFGISMQQALMNSIAVLVISCPCAMGLATPTAVMVGVGRVVKNGILIKGGQTLETFAKIENIVFDKTGTLTSGNFKIKNINYLHGEPEFIHAILQVLENYSSHPIAKSIVAELQDKPKSKSPFFKEVEEERGFGIKAIDSEGNHYLLGSFKMAQQFTTDHNHNVYLVINEKVVATIDLEDDLKKEVKEVVDYLKQEGINPILLSGDQKTKVAQVADVLKITQYHGEQSPEQKLVMIEELSKKGLTAMVGDGINDAPALAKADIGVSLSDASQAAIQSAEIVLLDGNLANLPKALSISKHTLLTIKQNLFWAFAYNLIAIPIAAMGFLNPMFGALFMAFSDVIVIGNSIRLKYKKIT